MWPFSPAYPASKPEDIGSPKILPANSDGKGVYDYIIVGGGTAGCVLASRLSEDPSVTVLLIERGGAPLDWASRVPLLSSDFARKDGLSVRWPATPLTNVDGRTLDLVVGSCLGGGSSINGMLYTRGSPSDFNRWSEQGRKGWSYPEIEKYFIKSEEYAARPVPDHHGTSGPWQTRPFPDFFFKSTEKCTESAKELGIPLVNDGNTPDAPAVCCGKMNFTIDREGHRSSTFTAFLPASLVTERKDRLHVCPYTLATSLRFHDEDHGVPRASGVLFEPCGPDVSENPHTYYAQARREIILCCGAIASPQLLMLSGIGPKAHLKKFGIRAIKDLPGVGSNLDHFGVSTIYRIPMSDSLHIMQKSYLRAFRELVKYLIHGEGLFISPFTQITTFIRSALLDESSHIRVEHPSQLDSSLVENIADIEIMPIAYNTSDFAIDKTDGVFSFLGVLLQPRSSGTVRLAYADPAATPICDLGFLSDPADYIVLRKIVKLSQALAQGMRREGYRMTDYNVPTSQSDEDLDAFIRKHARTTYHYSSTCRMAPENDTKPGVVDDELRVHGVLGLRVADCSIFPNIISNHLQAPAAMVAEKCADMLKSQYGH